MSLKKQGISNMLISYVGIILGLTVTILQTKILTPDQIGLISLIMTFVGILYYFVLVGAPGIILKFKYSYDENPPNQVTFLLIYIIIPLIMFVIVSIFILFFKNMIINYYADPLFSKYFNLIFIFLFANSFIQLFKQISRTFFKSVVPNFLETNLLRIINILFLIIVLIFNLEFSYYLYFLAFTNSFILILLIIYVMKNLKISVPNFKSFDFKDIRSHFSYGFVMLFSSFLGGIIYLIDKLMLGYYTTLEHLGIYTICITMGSLLKIIGSSLSLIAHPQIGEYWSKNDLESIDKLYKDTAKVQVYLGFFVFIFVYIFSIELISLLDPVYAAGYLVFILIVLGELINLSTGMCGGILALSKYYKYDLITLILLVVMNIILNIILIPLYGINGAAIATVMSLIIYNVVKVILVFKLFNIHPISIDYLKIAGAAILTLFILLIVKSALDEINFIMLAFIALMSFIVYNLIAIFLLKVDKVIFEYLNVYKLFVKK